MKKFGEKLVISVVIILTGFILSSGFAANKVTAKVDTIFVEDYAGILSDEDKATIRDINEVTFKSLHGSPQYAVVTLKNLKGYKNIEDYAQDKFQKLGIGSKEEDNGFLFVISIDERKYRLETGYGVEDVITDSMKDKIVSSDVEDKLKDKQYGIAVMMISHKIESIVTEKYGNYAVSVEAVKVEKARNQKILLAVVLAIFSIVIVILLAIAWYSMQKKGIRNKIEKFVSPNLKIYAKSLSSIQVTVNGSVTNNSQSIGEYYLSKHFATKIRKKLNWRKLAQDEIYLKDGINDYLLKDAITDYCYSKQLNGTHYTVNVYLDHELYNALYNQCSNLNFGKQVLTKNPLLSSKAMPLIADYVRQVTVLHKAALKITEQNKDTIKNACYDYLEQNGLGSREKTNGILEASLMMYYILKGKNLAQPDLVDSKMIDSFSMNEAYKFAKRKAKSIESAYKQEAINDLNTMMLGSYYLNSTMSWSHYNSSSSSSSDGGSSFGGGSSGGGGFSGGW